MNVLILNWRDMQHPLAGGAEISLFEHAKYWVKKGSNVTWFCSSFEGALPEETRDGIRIIRKGSQYTTHIFAFLIFLQRSGIQPDIIIDCFHFIPFFTPLYRDRRKIVALINEPAKNAWFKNISSPFSFIGYIVEPVFFRFYHNIPFITSASSISDELEKYGIRKKNISLIPHGVSIIPISEKFTKHENTVIYLGQLSEDKGIKNALYAFDQTRKMRKNVKMWIVGKAPNRHYEKEIHNLIKSLSLGNDVLFYGHVSEEKKMELLAKAAILIHPSIREGWGLTIIEANAVGTPAIGYNVTGLQDSIQDMKTGVLTKKNTPEGLAEMIILLLQDKKLYTSLSKNAKIWSKKFTWKDSGKKSWKLLKTVYG